MEASSTGVEGTVAADRDAAGSEPDGHDDHGDQSKVYLAVWGGLAALTAIEVWVAGTGLARTLMIWVLVGLAVWKAALVALYYMHLKFEPGRLWILALAPLPLPFILVLAVMQEF